MYCNDPWLLHSGEIVYLFGAVGDNDCNISLLGLVVGHGCMDDWIFHFLNIIDPTYFMQMLLLYFSFLGYSNDICSWCPTHICWNLSIYVFMNVILMFRCLNHHFGSLANLIPIF